jgi:hypothetical protein
MIRARMEFGSHRRSRIQLGRLHTRVVGSSDQRRYPSCRPDSECNSQACGIQQLYRSDQQDKGSVRVGKDSNDRRGKGKGPRYRRTDRTGRSHRESRRSRRDNKNRSDKWSTQLQRLDWPAHHRCPDDRTCRRMHRRHSNDRRCIQFGRARTDNNCPRGMQFDSSIRSDSTNPRHTFVKCREWDRRNRQDTAHRFDARILPTRHLDSRSHTALRENKHKHRRPSVNWWPIPTEPSHAHSPVAHYQSALSMHCADCFLLTSDHHVHRASTERHRLSESAAGIRVNDLAQLLPIGRTGHVAREQKHSGTVWSAHWKKNTHKQTMQQNTYENQWRRTLSVCLRETDGVS